MTSFTVRILVATLLLGTFGLLHFLHLVTHSVRLMISWVHKLNDRIDDGLVSLRIRRRDVRRDLRSIKKLPNHLAIIFIPINYQLNKYFDPRSYLKFLNLASFFIPRPPIEFLSSSDSSLTTAGHQTSSKNHPNSHLDNDLQLLKFQQRLELKSIMENVSKVLIWSMEAGVKEITFYDERGLLKSHKFELIQYLSNIPTFIKGNDHISWASIEPKLTEEVEILSKFEISYQLLVNSNSKKKKRANTMTNHPTSQQSTNGMERPPPPKQQSTTHRKSTIKINLIDRHQGHQHLAKVTRALVEIIKLNQQTKLTFDDLNVKTIGEKICSTSIGLPDLLLVLGGRSLRFRGFPPWQLTLTEIYHARSYAIRPYSLQYREYLEALNVFGNCEQRVGT